MASTSTDEARGVGDLLTGSPCKAAVASKTLFRTAQVETL